MEPTHMLRRDPITGFFESVPIPGSEVAPEAINTEDEDSSVQIASVVLDYKKPIGSQPLKKVGKKI